MPTPLPVLIDELRHAFPRQELTAGTLTVYVRELADLPVGVVELTVRELIRTCVFFPTVAELRAAAAERMMALPDEHDALAQVHARQEWARGSRLNDAPELHPAVEEAVRAIGGWHAFRSADRPEIVRAQFLKVYRENRARAVRDVQIGNLSIRPSLAA